MNADLPLVFANALARLADGLEPAHLVGVGGAVGALARHWVFQRLSWDSFPVATLAVNVLGSFLLGLVTFANPGPATAQFVGTGICGAFTTFSTFSVETVQLLERGDRRPAAIAAGSNLLASMGGIWLAWWLVTL